MLELPTRYAYLSRPIITGGFRMFEYKIDDEVSLHLIESTDAFPLLSLINESRPYLKEWLPWVDSMQSIADYDELIPEWRAQYYNNQGFQAIIRYYGEIAGMIGFHGINWGNKSTSLGYWIGHNFQGKGIMTRAVHGCLNYAFNTLNLHRVEIRCGVNNEKSRAIPTRLGFTEEGICREGEYLYDHYHDLVIYGMLKHEWKQAPYAPWLLS